MDLLNTGSRILRSVVLSAVLVIIFGASAQAAKVTKTNVEGLVVKYVKCMTKLSGYVGVDYNLVNRTAQAQKGTIFVRAIDSDGDPISTGSDKFSIPAASGEKMFTYFNCYNGTTFLFSIKR